VGCEYPTLHLAIVNAQAGDTIDLQEAVQTESGIVVNKDLTFIGQGIGLTTLQAHADPALATDRIFWILPGVTVTISDMTIQHANASGFGGGAFNQGNLTLKDVVFQGNTANKGGGIYNKGTLAIQDSVFDDNEAAYTGGGINNGSLGIAIIKDSTLSNNRALDPQVNQGDGGGAIYNQAEGQVTLNTVLVQGNFATDDGGAIDNEGWMWIKDCTFLDNEGLSGGAISNNLTGTISIVKTLIEGNNAVENGGGLRNFKGLMVVSRSTIFNNTALRGGGAVNGVQGSLVVSETVVYSNTSSLMGSALFNLDADTTIQNSTISGNEVTAGDGALVNMIGTILLENSTVFDNLAVGITELDNLSGVFTSHNSIAANSAATNVCGGTIATDGLPNLSNDGACGFSLVAAPMLGPLSDNGGETLTMPLLVGSLALEAGDNATCLPVDQRGVIRPQGPTCDLGAFELEEPRRAIPVADD
jgi:predicted outer membrane repeat protein